MPTLTIGLLWHSSNSPNLGIGALTISNIAIIEALAEKLGISVRFRIFQWRDPEPVYVVADNVEIIAMRARHMLFHPAYLKPIRQCDMILDIGAGDSFADIYGTKRFTLIALSKLCVILSRRPLILPPQTIGPFQKALSRRVARFLMNRAKAVVTRDELSTKFAHDLGISTPVTEATDVAMLLPYEAADKASNGKIKVGINISGLLFNGGYTKDNQFGLSTDYPAMARALIQGFLDQDGCEVHLVPHVVPRNMPVEDDHAVSEILKSEFPEVIVAPRFESPSSAKQYISGMDFFCGARMHACIAAFSSGVPMVSHAYSRKFVGVFGTLGYPWLADLKTMGTDEVVKTTLDAFNQRDQLTKDMTTAMAGALAKLQSYEQILEQTMLSCLGKT